MRRLLLLTAVLSLSACQINIAGPAHTPLTGTWEGTSDGVRVALSMSESPAKGELSGGIFLNGSGTITTVVTGESIPFRVFGFYGIAGVTLGLEVIDGSDAQGTVAPKYYGHFKGDIGSSETIVGHIDSPTGTLGPFAARGRLTSMTFVRR